MMRNQQVVIFEDEDVSAHYVAARDSGRDILVVTFGALDGIAKGRGTGFGEAFLASKGFAAVHVLPRKKNWYQNAGTPSLIAHIRDISSRYETVVAYGTSMGAYAAILFSGRLQAQRVLAIAPQFSVDRVKVPFETRWAKLAESITFRDDDLLAAINPDTVIEILYDNVGVDARHVSLINASNVRRRPFPFAGHGVPGYLREVGLLSQIVEQGLETGIEWAGVRQKLKTNRRAVSTYWENMAYMTAGIVRRRRLLQAAVDRLIEFANIDPRLFVIISSKSRVANPSIAQQCLIEAIGRGYMNDDILLRLLRLMKRHSLAAELWHSAEVAFQAIPSEHRVMRARILRELYKTQQ